jgi:hypothetical protein
MIFPVIYDGTPVDVVGLSMMIGLGLISLLLLVLFLRGIARTGSSRP